MFDHALRAFMYGKIHRVTVTDANQDYIGSITVDTALLQAARILPQTAVDVVNDTNGNRLTTYVIEGEPNSGTICLNGAAAHHFSPGDIAIIIGYEQVPARDIPGRIFRAVHVDAKNRITQVDESVTSGLEEYN